MRVRTPRTFDTTRFLGNPSPASSWKVGVTVWWFPAWNRSLWMHNATETCSKNKSNPLTCDVAWFKREIEDWGGAKGGASDAPRKGEEPETRACQQGIGGWSRAMGGAYKKGRGLMLCKKIFCAILTNKWTWKSIEKLNYLHVFFLTHAVSFFALGWKLQ